MCICGIRDSNGNDFPPVAHSILHQQHDPGYAQKDGVSKQITLIVVTVITSYNEFNQSE